MNLLTIAWKSIRQRALASSLTALSVALGVALMVAVLVINGVISRMFNQTGSGYDLILGPKGSDAQLVLSTIYRISRPIENLPWRFYEEVKSDPRVERAIPIALGDTTEEGGFPIVGTTPTYFSTDYAYGRNFVSKSGHGLKGPWDAVIGSEVARTNQWDMGSTFKIVHGGGDASDAHIHDEVFTVRDVLAPTGTPNDRTCFVDIRGFLMLDGHEKPLDEAFVREAEMYGETLEQVAERYKDCAADEHADHDHAHADGEQHFHDICDAKKEITSILLVMAVPEGVTPGLEDITRQRRALDYSARMKEGFKAQAVKPVEVMRQLMNNLVGNVRYALMVLTGLIIAVSGIGIFVSIYNSMSERRREIAVMRALGARRQTVFSIIVAESILLTVGGGLLGLLLGHALVFLASPIVQERSGLLIDPFHFERYELLILPVLLVMAVVIGLLPGLTAYRTDVARALYD